MIKHFLVKIHCCLENEADVYKLSDEKAAERGYLPTCKTRMCERWVNIYNDTVIESWYHDTPTNRQLHVIAFNSWEKEQREKADKLLTITND